MVKTIIRIGTKRLGEPRAAIRNTLAELEDVDLLNTLFDRVQEIASWEDLFERDIEN